MSLKQKVRELHSQGFSQQQIANQLGCSKSTVHHHIHVEAKVKNLERQRRSRKALSEWVKKIKESNPCADCGNIFPYYVMDFDHVDGEKIQNISRLSRGSGGKKKLLEELKKCELICSNCHRIRTHERSARKKA